MSRFRHKIPGFILISVFLFNACSTKKDAFINRNWHALNTKYNVLYNGSLAFEEGREALNSGYQDNYWELLPVERLEVPEEIRLDSEGNTPTFERAEEKASKAIQKHSMDIKDVERNPKTADAFLLLGKSRYFDHRYIPALEAFNYILNKYDKNDKLNEARIWREKVNIRLENEETAIDNLKRLLKFEQLGDQEYADARAILAQAYINLGVRDTAIQNLKVAAYYTKRKPQKGRYYYIIGQLYNGMGHKDSANMAFDQVLALKRRSPRIYMINAELEKLRNTEITEANKEEIFEYLVDLEENRESRPFLDKIYRQVGEYHLHTGNDSLALVYLNKSLRAAQNDAHLNAMNYQDLAEHNFDLNQYKIAGAYYDSLLQNLKQNTKAHRATQKKLDNLEDVIKYEDIAFETDSILGLAAMDKDAQIAYFENYVAELKKAEEEAAEEKQKRRNDGFIAFGQTPGGKENKGKFYFYNITSLGHGKTEFTRRWGDRPLEDNWRWSNRAGAITTDQVNATLTENGTQVAQDSTAADRYDAAYYVNSIPTDSQVLDSLSKERNFANYQLGLIYKEKFKENSLAAAKLEDVLRSNPEERLVLPSKYNLYKIYEEVGSPLASKMKQNIIENHADSRYAEILMNPQAVLADSSDSPDARYAHLLEKFREQQFLQVITGAEENIGRFTGDPIVPKFEMLKANAIGRLQGFDRFREALNYVALAYPNNPEGKKAEQMVAEQLPKLANKEFLVGTESNGTANWKVVFPFKRRHDADAEALAKVLKKSIVDLRYKNVVSKDIYNLEDQFVVVHGFRSKDYALGYVELLKNNKDYKINKENFVILSSNYKIIQVHKNLEEYRDSQKTPKP
ncbi:MAG: tetratricopeptide repeat protein [Flavobacteriaceae bacterium]